MKNFSCWALRMLDFGDVKVLLYLGCIFLSLVVEVSAFPEISPQHIRQVQKCFAILQKMNEISVANSLGNGQSVWHLSESFDQRILKSLQTQKEMTFENLLRRDGFIFPWDFAAQLRSQEKKSFIMLRTATGLNLWFYNPNGEDLRRSAMFFPLIGLSGTYEPVVLLANLKAEGPVQLRLMKENYISFSGEDAMKRNYEHEMIHFLQTKIFPWAAYNYYYLQFENEMSSTDLQFDTEDGQNLLLAKQSARTLAQGGQILMELQAHRWRYSPFIQAPERIIHYWNRVQNPQLDLTDRKEAIQGFLQLIAEEARLKRSYEGLLHPDALGGAIHWIK